MLFSELPIEIGVLIFDYLDLKTRINAYESCEEIRHFFAPHHAKRFILCKSCIGKVKTLSSPFFTKYRGYIQELNLSGIPDITADVLKPHVPYLLHLRTLDVTFTDIYLSDMKTICPPYLRNISINFFKCPRLSRKRDDWNISKSVFKEKTFQSIHFIVFEFLDSRIPLEFLDGVPRVSDLKITIADNYKDFWDTDVDDATPNLNKNFNFNFSRLSFVFRECRVTHKTAACLHGLATLDFSKIEFIFLMYLEKIVIFASPVFKSLFLVNCSDLKVKLVESLPLDLKLDVNIIFKAWNKSTTLFNKEFYENVRKELKDYFPTYYCMHSKIKLKVIDTPSDWYCIDSGEELENNDEDLPEKITLTDFCRKDGSILRGHRPVNLSKSIHTLKKLSFLGLRNICVNDDFFRVLFAECRNLETLDFYMEQICHDQYNKQIMFLMNYINLTKSLKNVKITFENIDYRMLFEALSRCPTLENVHVCEYERALDNTEFDVTNIVAMIKNCQNLYSLFMEADMFPETLTMLMSPLRDVSQKLGRDHLVIEVCDCYRGWNPFADVFSPSPLHILD